MEVDGKTALVTGAARGIGLGVATELLTQGMTVVLADLDQAELATVGDRLRQEHEPSRVLTHELDVTSVESWRGVVDRCCDQGPGIDVLCNNAGIGQGLSSDGKPLRSWELEPGLVRAVVDVNLMGVFHGVREVGGAMVRRGEGGHIVNTSSMAGLIAPAALGLYAATKYAVMGLSESLRAELRPYGIGVSILCPGGVNTDFNRASLERAGVTVDAAAAGRLVADAEQKMEPAEVGKRVWEGIMADDPYIITHPEYAELVGHRLDAVRRAFAVAPAKTKRDPADLLARSTNPEYQAYNEED